MKETRPCALPTTQSTNDYRQTQTLQAVTLTLSVSVKSNDDRKVSRFDDNGFFAVAREDDVNIVSECEE